jgi:hypothetical protein
MLGGRLASTIIRGGFVHARGIKPGFSIQAPCDYALGRSAAELEADTGLKPSRVRAT